MAFWYTCSSYTAVDSQSLFTFLRCMSTLFSFLSLLFTTYTPCLLMCFYLLLCTWTLYFSFLFRIIPSMWVIVPAKPWWSIETFGMLIPPKDDENGRTALVSLWLLARCACFIVCFDNKSVFLLSTFSQSGFPIHWFVFAYHFFMLCLIVFSQTVLSDAQDSQINFPSNSKCCVSLPFWIRLLNNRNNWVSLHH